MKPQPNPPSWCNHIQLGPLDDGGFGFSGEDRDYKAPYSPGDRLWVRETWRPIASPSNPEECDFVIYKADDQTMKEKWKPSIHMPKWAARIWLEVTGVRVERIKDISSEDCFKEGIDIEGDAYAEAERFVTAGSPCPPERYAFITLWNQIYPDSWLYNDWVWVTDFIKEAP